MQDNDLNVHVFQNRNWCSPKSDRRIFFLTLTVRTPFHRKDFKWKKNMVMRRYFLKKRKLFMKNLTKEQKQPPVVILQQSIFDIIFIWCLWLRIIRRSDQSVQFTKVPSQLFLMILIMVTEHVFWRKFFCGCFSITWLRLLRGHSKSMLAQDSWVFTPPSSLFTLVCFGALPPHPSPRQGTFVLARNYPLPLNFYTYEI